MATIDALRRGYANERALGSSFLPHRAIPALLVGLVWFGSAPARAVEVLDQVPRDAVGFAVVRNLAAVDARLAKILDSLQLALPRPLAMVQSVTGVGEGLDFDRDLLIVLLPGADSQQFHLAVWLPVKDYDALVRSLDGDPERRVAAVTVAGEDLLAVRHQDWALVSDPDQRDRLEMLRGSASPPKQAARWKPWIETNDAALVLLPAGLKLLSGWVESQAAASPDNRRIPNPSASSDASWRDLEEPLRELLALVPQPSAWGNRIESAACGVRLDAAGNAVVGSRLAFVPGALRQQPDAANVVPPRLYAGGDFIVTGNGLVNPELVVAAVTPYLRQAKTEFSTGFNVTLGDSQLDDLREEVEKAARRVRAFSLLTRPGSEGDGIFSNRFLVVSVDSTAEFLGHADQAMQQWNAPFETAKDRAGMVFEAKPTEIAERTGTEYSIDMVSAWGTPDLPGLRDSQEKLFGPGGRFRLQFVGVDEHTALLAVGTQEQAAKIISALKGGAVAETPEELRHTAELFTGSASWQVYFSPTGYFAWINRQFQAIAGGVFGGPLVREFPAAPPIGAAGGLEGDVAWIEVALPIGTMRHAFDYYRQQ